MRGEGGRVRGAERGGELEGQGGVRGAGGRVRGAGGS